MYALPCVAGGKVGGEEIENGGQPILMLRLALAVFGVEAESVA